MGHFTVEIEVGGFEGTQFESLDALVDTGARHLVVARSVLESLGVEPTEKMVFALADELRAELDVGDCLVRLDGRTHPMVVVFGGDGGRALLGAVALEAFGLRVDPVRRRLVPVEGLLMAHRPVV